MSFKTIQWTSIALLTALPLVAHAHAHAKTRRLARLRGHDSDTNARNAYNPYAALVPVPSFTVRSLDVQQGKAMPTAQRSGVFGAGGRDISPQLSWAGFPQGTRSFVVTVYDPDAPTASGFWHWAVINIPANVTSLPSNAGAENSTTLPSGAVQLPNDASLRGYIGAAPPKNSGKHHYYIVVHALDVDSLALPSSATPAFLGFNLQGHTLARAIMVPTSETK